MQRRKRLGYGLLAGLVSVAGVGCADSDLTVLILHDVIPDDGCIIDPGNTRLLRGILDVSAEQPYLFTPIVQSTAVAIEGQGGGGTDNIVILEGANVELVANEFDSASTDVVTHMTTKNETRRRQLFSASVRPGEESGVGYPIIDPSQAFRLRRCLAGEENCFVPGPDGAGTEGPPSPDTQLQLIAKTSVFGDIEGNGVESPDFNFPVTICNGCLTINAGPCPLQEGTPVLPGNPCNPFQDVLVTCCELAGALICPAPLP